MPSSRSWGGSDMARAFEKNRGTRVGDELGEPRLPRLIIPHSLPVGKRKERRNTGRGEKREENLEKEVGRIGGEAGRTGYKLQAKAKATGYGHGLLRRSPFRRQSLVGESRKSQALDPGSKRGKSLGVCSGGQKPGVDIVDPALPSYRGRHRPNKPIQEGRGVHRGFIRDTGQLDMTNWILPG